MALSNFPGGRLLALLLLSLGFGGSAAAQTAPTWQSAAAFGPNAGSSGTTVAATATDPAGNLYLAGSFQGTATFGGTTLTSVGIDDGYLAKLSPAGALLWVRQIGSDSNDGVYDLVVDEAGNAYVTGKFSNTITLGNGLTLTYVNGNNAALFLVRYSPQGTPEWAQQSQTPPFSRGQGTGLGLDALGNVYLTGIYSRTLTIGATTLTSPNVSFPDGFLSRFSAATGTLQYLTTIFHFTGNSATYTSPRLAVTPTGTTYLLNTFYQDVIFDPSTTLPSRGGSDGVVAQYNAQGNLQWVQQIGGADDDAALAGTLDAAGNLYLAGSFTSPATFGQTPLPGSGTADGYLAKLTPQGQLQWVQAGGGPGHDTWNAVRLDATGAPCVTGSFENQAQYGPWSVSSAGLSDIVVAAYTAQGQIRWAQQAGSWANDAGLQLLFTAQGDLSVVGTLGLGQTGSFGPLTLVRSPYFLARLGTSALAARPAQPRLLHLYPNPATDQVQLRGLPAGTQVQVVDALGRVVRESALTPAGRVSVQGLGPGLYTLRATDAQGRPFVGRLLVE